MSYHTIKDNTIRHIFISLLGVFLLCVPACASAQDIPATDKSGGIIIVPTLDKYRNIRQLKEKDFGGYLMVYFKDKTLTAFPVQPSCRGVASAKTEVLYDGGRLKSFNLDLP
ncbi:MAG: hypothetical protein JW927_15215 [Deltaproteobacteria bacterium]|nr:hypothetical protein [Deltaproteobacteria bacterium]